MSDGLGWVGLGRVAVHVCTYVCMCAFMGAHNGCKGEITRKAKQQQNN